MRADGGPGPGPGTDVALREGGFALAFVVLLLFAIGLAGATSYEIVRTEAAMAVSGMQSTQALAAAQAGLVRFMAEEDDTLPVERTYLVEDAPAVVTPRLVLEPEFPNRIYRITSVGSYVDARFVGTVAERTVSQFALHQRAPVNALGAFVSPSTDITLDGVDDFDGDDAAAEDDCTEAPVDDIAGVVGGGSISIRGGGVSGSPRSASYGSAAAVLDSLGVDWSALTDPSFPVEYDDTWPNFATLHPDTFPVIRWNRNLNANALRIGRGILIVDGDLRLRTGFIWDGIILAGTMPTRTRNESFLIRGLLVAGLDGSGDRIEIEDAGSIYFHSCNVLEAGVKLAHLEPMSRTWWEVN